MSELGLGMQPVGQDDDDGDRRRRRSRRSAVAVVIALLVVGAFVLAMLEGWSRLRGVLTGPDYEDYAGPGTGEVVVEVEPGATAVQVGQELVAEDVVASMAAWRAATAQDERATAIQPGHYEMRRQMSAEDAFERILDPSARVETLVQLREGLRLDLALDRMAESTGVPREEYQALAEDPVGLGLPDWSQGELEGFVFPATYTFGPEPTAEEVLGATVDRFKVAAGATGLDAGAVIDGEQRTPHDLLTVASLIEAEAPAEARAEVARVVYNRLAEGMPLQFDSTVNYVTGKDTITTTPEDRETDSPYNTYRYAGLPPGPINSPGEDAMVAAMQPAEGDWLYFVTVNPDTGETKFAETLEEHNRNVQEFRDWLRQNG